MLVCCLCNDYTVIFKQTKEDSTHPDGAQTFYIITQSFFYPLWITPGNTFNRTHSITHILQSMTEAFPDTHTHTRESQCCRAFSAVCEIVFHSVIHHFPLRWSDVCAYQVTARASTPAWRFNECRKSSPAQTSSSSHVARFCRRAPSFFPSCVCERQHSCGQVQLEKLTQRID